MAKFQIITREEFALRTPSEKVLQRLAPFRDYVKTLEIGGAGKVELEAQEKRAVVKDSLKMVMHEMGMHPKYARSGNGTLIFEVTDLATYTPRKRAVGAGRKSKKSKKPTDSQ